MAHDDGHIPTAMPVGGDDIPVAIPVGDDDEPMPECLFREGSISPSSLENSTRFPKLSQRERFQMVISLGEAMKTYIRVAGTEQEDSSAFVGYYRLLCGEINRLSEDS